MAWEQLLELADLGPTRAARELNKRLAARKTEFYKGEAVAECEDNSTRMRATDDLIDINGLRKTAVDVHHAGTIGTAPVVHIYLPDNGRGDAFAPPAKNEKHE